MPVHPVDFGWRKCSLCSRTLRANDFALHMYAVHQHQNQMVSAAVSQELEEEKLLRKQVEEAKDDIKHWLEDEEP